MAPAAAADHPGSEQRMTRTIRKVPADDDDDIDPAALDAAVMIFFQTEPARSSGGQIADFEGVVQTMTRNLVGPEASPVAGVNTDE